jgi:hypothetical protein
MHDLVEEMAHARLHPDNQRSLRNALSVGRRVVGGYVWVTPSGLPGMPRH